jgi:hypothetical protein
MLIRIALMATLLFSGTTTAHAQATAPEDIKGWRNTTWGMTVEEAAAALGAEAQSVSAEEARAKGWAWEKKGLVARLRLPNYEAAGRRFDDAQLGFDTNGKLQFVRLAARPTAAEAGALFSALESDLTARYGTPSRRALESPLKQISWTLKSTIVGLSLASFPGGPAFVDVTYEPRPTGGGL